MRLPTFVRIIFLIMLSLGTILFSGTFVRFETASKNLLHNPDFQDDFAGWQIQRQDSVTVDKGILTLSNHPKNNERTVSITQTIIAPPEQRLLVLSGVVRSSDVIPGEKRWETARLLLVPITTEGKQRYDVPHGLVQLRGTTPWKEYKHAFRLPKDISSVSVVIQLLNSSGTMEVQSISLRFAIENPSYLKWQHRLMLVWISTGLWIVWPLLRAMHRRPGRKAILVTSGIILLGILIPASVKYAITPFWLLPETEVPGPFRVDLLPATVPFSFELLPTELGIYKLAHFLLFTLIGYLLISRRMYGIPISMQVGITSLFALATESMQALASGRGGKLSDVLIDLCGVLAGMLVAAAMSRLTSGTQYRRHTQKPNGS